MLEALRNLLKSFLPHPPPTSEEKMAAVAKIEAIIAKAGTISVRRRGLARELELWLPRAPRDGMSWTGTHPTSLRTHT